MTKINEPTNINSTKRTTKKAHIGGTDSAHSYFADIMAMVDMATNINEVASNAAILSSAPIAAMDNLMAMQESSSEAQNHNAQRQQQIKSANLALDSLEELRLTLLAGEIPHYLLTSIESNMNALKHKVQNPDLREIIEDIELRAAVELAKFYFQR